MLMVGCQLIEETWTGYTKFEEAEVEIPITDFEDTAEAKQAKAFKRRAEPTQQER